MISKDPLFLHVRPIILTSYFFVIKINAYKYNLAFSYLSYRLYDMHGNKIPPQLVTQVGDAFKRILEEVSFAFA